jgi:hypothetical protein
LGTKTTGGYFTGFTDMINLLLYDLKYQQRYEDLSQFFLVNISYSRIPRLPGVNKLRIVAVVVTVIIIIIIMAESVVTVQAGYRDVVLYLGQ